MARHPRAGWFDPSTAPPQITAFGMLYAIHDALCAPAGAEDGPQPGRELDRERRRTCVRVQAAPRAQVPQRRSRHRGGREIQLRALSGRRRTDPARARPAGGGASTRSPCASICESRGRTSSRSTARPPAPRASSCRGNTCHRWGRRASRSIRSVPGPSASSATRPASRSCSTPYPEYWRHAPHVSVSP